MNRIFKFRAWNKEESRMIDLNGFDIAFKEMENQGEVTAVIEQGNIYMYDVSDVDLMQFTGLKDKNGVEIYEGDIVKWGHIEGYIEMSGVRIAVVDYSEPHDGLTFDAFKPTCHRFKIGNFMYRRHTDKCMEVIGNIHQNPELIEGYRRHE